MKKIVAISDVHVKKPGDTSDHILIQFLSHPEVLSADYVLLLGDIYDLMVGPHEEYLKQFHHHFELLQKLGSLGKKIYFFEGNHDVHIKKLFSKASPNGEIVVSQAPVLELIDGKVYYFSHGDEHEVDNISYHKYIKFIRSAPLEFIANYIMPYKVINLLGENASKFSRKKGSKQFNAERVRARFRAGVTQTFKENVDFILGGHSHVQDLFTIPGTQSTYINNGYAPHTKTFIHVEGHKINFFSLN